MAADQTKDRTGLRGQNSNMTADADPLLRMTGIVKSFPGVQALRAVDLELQAGEVVALLGENGAGKSTLIKVLSGAHRPDEGRIEIEGRPLDLGSPHGALAAGIAVIYQEFNLVPGLSAVDNIFLGQERTSAGFLHRRRERERAAELFRRMDVDIDPDAPVGRLTVAQQQIVEIAKALAQNAKILVMDEPSATLTLQEVERLFVVIRELQAQGIGVIYISHRLDEIFAVANRVVVLRDGERVGQRSVSDVSREQLIELMVGRQLDQEFPPRTSSVGDCVLDVRNLTRGDAVRGVSFQVRRGEIVGLTGLVGAGRTETARLIFGADRPDAGEFLLNGEPLRIRNPSDAIRSGICLLTEDRKSEGLVIGHSIRENFGLPNLPQWSSGGLLNGKGERAAFSGWIEKLQIRTANMETPARNLSGGNQQKVVLSRWLQRNCDVLIFDEPTRGIDVGARYEIYQLMNSLVAGGKAILMISSELPEVLGMSDRILVMREGRISGEITDVPKATQQDIMTLAVGAAVRSALR